MEKIVVCCAYCSFSFITSNHPRIKCPACSKFLERDSDGLWVRATPIIGNCGNKMSQSVDKDGEIVVP